ncbi:GTP-binding protein Di-Ras1b [Trichomycterus rosablanca]|uniref:GTP-binding protein Di-Ras1b n=1 Tax=Trichomycterus rosablanca TaxID=2290929 RepID=UPI002F35044A
MPERSGDYRVVLFGSGAVGKTSLVLRFVKETFHDSYNPTVEDTYWQVIGCERSVCMLHITDTSGSYQFPAMQRLNISKSDAFILVYSVTSRRSLEELKPVHQQVVAIRGNVEQVPIMLVGNKSDDESLREVQAEDGAAEAQAWKCGFIETSAKNQQKVTELFQELLKLEKKRNLTLIDHGKLKQDGSMKRRCSVM